MIDASRFGKSVTINGRTVHFDQRVDALVVLSDRVIIRLRVHDFEIGDPLVGRNILSLDENAEILWRIPATGVTLRAPDGREAPEAYFGLWRDGNKVKTGTPDGFEFEIDPDTGEISNPKFTK